MKAISLWQPWASLVIDGRKKIETRSWAAPKWLVGQEIAIHATKRCEWDFARECGYGPEIPRGAILGIVRLTTTAQFNDKFYANITRTQEGKYGDFYPGRWGWFFELIEKFEQPFEQRGQQGIFDWQRPCNARSSDGG